MWGWGGGIIERIKENLNKGEVFMERKTQCYKIISFPRCKLANSILIFLKIEELSITFFVLFHNILSLSV